jgi:hypothetical protein
VTSPKGERAEIEHEATRGFSLETGEVVVLVEARRGFVDRVGHEQAKCDAVETDEVERQPQSLTQEICPDAPSLHSTIDCEPRQENT